ncbi:MAG: HlyD family efflux transporter periplasmic adaptor subunit, partial [Candidatus Cloacimonetes bacterium]|nr:HlyD family efflux transporter periplasmic adaptor subunit [Candidatus Cloacimonadota bacterium]
NNDFQLVFKEIETLKSEINNLRNEKGILTENISLTVSKNLIDLEKINSEISEMEIEIKNLKIFSSVSGIISDLEYNPGEMVKKGAAVIKVSTLENPVLVAYGNAFSMKNIKVGMKAKVISDKRKIYGKVISVSPIMKKIKSLTTSFETANTYAEILIEFDDPELALKYISIGQRLVVKIYF